MTHRLPPVPPNRNTASDKNDPAQQRKLEKVEKISEVDEDARSRNKFREMVDQPEEPTSEYPTPFELFLPPRPSQKPLHRMMLSWNKRSPPHRLHPSSQKRSSPPRSPNHQKSGRASINLPMVQLPAPLCRRPPVPPPARLIRELGNRTPPQKPLLLQNPIRRLNKPHRPQIRRRLQTNRSNPLCLACRESQ